MFINDMVTLLQSYNFGTFGVDYGVGPQFAQLDFALPSGQLQIVLQETGGTAPENTQNSVITPAYLKPTLQVTVRGTDYMAVRLLAEQAYLAMFAVRNQFINSGWYRKIRPLQEPFPMTDTNGNVLVKFNVMAETSQGRIVTP